MLRIEDLTYRVGGRTLLEGASASIPAGHRVGLIGRNGTGKSTLLKLITGELECDAGSVAVPPDWRIGTVAQEMPAGSGTPADFVLTADRERTSLLAEAETAQDPMRIAEVHTRLADIGAAAAPARAAAILAGLGFSEPEQQRPLDNFSGGWRMRVALAATLFATPELLLLDEPSNHLDLEARIWLETHLAAYPGTLVLVSHDRGLLNAVPTAILHLDECRLTLYRGDYDNFERTRRERLRLAAATYVKQIEQRRKMQAFVDRFRYKASKARQAQSRLKAIERLGDLQPVQPDSAVAFDFPDPDPLPPPLIAMEDVAVGYVPGKPVLTRLSLTLDQTDRIGLLGSNGNGKTTFLRLLSGELKPQEGTLRRSSKLRVGYFVQEQADAFDLDATPYTTMAARMPKAMEPRVRGHLGRFGFTQGRADVAVGSLSGGEKAKLLFACITYDAPHVLLLDEPTNHLDIDSRDALVSALNAYDGAVILVSHDPGLLSLCADRLWVVRGGRCTAFDGDLDDYRRQTLAEQRAGRRGDRAEADGVGADSSRQNRKEGRRARADQRAALADLRRKAKEAQKRMERLTAERAQLEAQLADPQLYERSGEKVAGINKRHAEVKAALADCEAQWLKAEEAIEESAEG